MHLEVRKSVGAKSATRKKSSEILLNNFEVIRKNESKNKES